MKKQLDITGDVCPMTFVRVKIAMETLGEEETLEVVLNREDMINVMESVKTEGYKVLNAGNEGDNFRLELAQND